MQVSKQKNTFINSSICKVFFIITLLLTILTTKANTTTFTFVPTSSGPFTANFSDVSKWDHGLPTANDSAILIIGAINNANTTVVLLVNENFAVQSLTVKSTDTIYSTLGNQCLLSINTGGSLLVSNTTTIIGGAKNNGAGNVATYIDVHGTFNTNYLLFDATTSSTSARNNIFLSVGINSHVAVNATVSISATIAQNNTVYIKNAAAGTFNVVDLTTVVPNVQTAFNVAFNGYVTVNGNLSLASPTSAYLVDSSNNNSGILFGGDTLKLGTNAGTVPNYPIKTLAFNGKANQTVNIDANALLSGTSFQNIEVGFADTTKEIVTLPIPAGNFNIIMDALTPLSSTQYPYIGIIGTSIGAGAEATTYDSSFFAILMRKIQDYQGVPHEEAVLCDFGQVSQHGLTYDNNHYYLNLEGPTGRNIVTAAPDFGMSFTGKYNRIGFWSEHSLVGQKIRYYMDGVLYHTDTIKSNRIYSTIDSSDAFTPDDTQTHNWHIKLDSAVEVVGLIRLQNTNYSNKPFSFINYSVYGSIAGQYTNNIKDLIAVSGISSSQKGVILYEGGANDPSVETLDQYRGFLYGNLNALVNAGLKVFCFYDHRNSIDAGYFSYNDGWVATKEVCTSLGVPCYSLGSINFFANNWTSSNQDFHPNNAGMRIWENVIEYGIANARTAWNLPTVQFTGAKSIFVNSKNAPNMVTIKKGTTLNLNSLTLDRDTDTGIGTLTNYGTLIVGSAHNFPDKYSLYHLDSSSTVIYDGTVPQTVSTKATYGNIVFNNQFLSPPQFSSISDVTIAATASFANGVFSNKIVNPLTFTTTSASTSSNNQESYVNGYITKIGSAAAFTFQLGSDSETTDAYHPLILSDGFTSATCSYNYNQVPNITARNIAIISLDPFAYWVLNGKGNASVRVLTRDESATFAKDGNFFLIGYNIGKGQWETLPGSNNVSNTTVGGQWISTGIINLSDYSAFTVGSNTFLSPVVTLNSFSVKISNNCKVGLAWASTKEISSNYYVVQYSNDNGNTYIDIDTVRSHNSPSGASYADTIAGINNGYALFRLKIVNKDGGTLFSPEQTLLVKCTAADLAVAPNPVKDVLLIKGLNGKNTIEVFAATGKLVTSTTTSNASTSMNMANFANGIYLIIIRNEQRGDKTITKVLKE